MQRKYRRMVGKMVEQDKEQAVCARPWVLYILRCSNNTFYTGVTNDLERRLKMHNNGKASRYTRARRPVELVYHERCTSRARALARECQVKDFSRVQKEALVKNGKANNGQKGGE